MKDTMKASAGPRKSASAMLSEELAQLFLALRVLRPSLFSGFNPIVASPSEQHAAARGSARTISSDTDHIGAAALAVNSLVCK